MTKILIALFAINSFLIPLSAQVTTDPEFPTSEAACTIFFDATGTGLEGYNGDVYAHTGVTADGSQWQYVIGDWGNNSNQPQLTKTGTNQYELELIPTIRDFYNVPASKEITGLCIVFRSADDPYLQTSPDIFIDVFGSELMVIIQEPGQENLLVLLNDPINIQATSPLADSLFLYVNDELVTEVAGITLNETILADNFGSNWTDYWVKVMAKNETETAVDSFSYQVIANPVIADLPAGMVDGINYVDESTVVLSLYAPFKNYVFAIGEFNGWDVGEVSYMNRTNEGDRFWIQLDGITPGEEYAYQYFVDGESRIGDPYCEKVLDPWNDQYISNTTYPNLKPYPTGFGEGIVSVFQTNQEEYVWQNTSFDPPEITDLVVYELLVRDFTNQHTYLSLIDTLSYLKNMGINAIELMPVNEFEGNSSWGYNPNYYFAVDKYYGPKNTLKQFIDVCHSEGIAVILDVVYNHSFGTSPYVLLYWDNGQPAEDSPFYNVVARHDYNVGFDMNHESEATKQYISRAIKFWIEEFKVDGYRFDLSKGFTQTNTLGNVNQWGQYDQSRIDILEAYADTIWSVNENAYVILEHFADNSEEKVLANDGCMIWGNMNHNYLEASMGWTANSDLSWASYQQRNWNDPHLVTYMESHDEERMMYKNVTWGNSSNPGHDVKDTTVALRRVLPAAAFFFTIPGPKMIWQFGELGYDYTIDYNGRTGEKPIRWDYFDDYRRKLIYDVFTALIHLKTDYPTFRTTDFDLSVGGAQKQISLNHADMNALIIGNFSVNDGSINANFQHTGMWYDYFSGDSLDVSSTSQSITLGPGKFRIYTDVQLETPQVELGLNDPLFENSPVIKMIYPNPSDGEVHIDFSVENKSNVNISIYDLDGRIISVLTNKEYKTGDFSITWDITGLTGQKVNPGIYFCVVDVNGLRDVKKIVIK